MRSSKPAQLAKMAGLIKATFSPAEIADLIVMITPEYSRAELSAEEFAELLSRLKPVGAGRSFSAKSVEAARLVLVQGATHTEAARELGMSQAQVGQVIKRIRGHIERSEE